jgi:hypothetical protein
MGAAAYEVLDVCHCYSEDVQETSYPCSARLGKVVATVMKKGV